MAPESKSPSRRSRLLRFALQAFVALQSNFLARALDTPDALAIKLAVSSTIVLLIGVINYSLLRYFGAISARNDDHHHRPTAIAISLGLFVLLIVAYAALYGIEMPQSFQDAAAAGTGLTATLHQVVGAIYFSTITIATLGYGDIAPQGDLARFTAAIEAINGLIAFGVFTGAVTGFMATKAVETTNLRDTVEQKSAERDDAGA